VNSHASDPNRETPAHPALERRARLFELRPASVRRRTRRVGARILILIIADVVALMLARAAIRSAVAMAALTDRIPRDVTAAGPLADPGEPSSLVFGVTLIMALAFSGAYSGQRMLHISVRLAAATALAAVATAVPLAAVIGLRSAILQCLIVAAGTWVVLIPARFVGERILTNIWPRDRGASPAILVGPDDSFASPVAAAIRATGGDFRIVAEYSTGDVSSPHERRDVVAGVSGVIDRAHAEAIILCHPLPEQHLRDLVEVALEGGCQLLYPARALRLNGLRPRLVWHRDQPFFELGAPVLKSGAVIAKRATDLIVASLVAIIGFPLMVVIAIAIKMDSPGPVLFHQARAGLAGRQFKMLKFRTMRTGADEEKIGLAHLNRSGDVRLFKIPVDPRVTRIGSFLRRWSLDELPQLWNVLRGDMSLVGPRPFFESDFAAYDDRHFRRLDTKPGITGLWQVTGRSDTVVFEDVVFLDRQYIEQWSFWLDVSILFRTIPAVIRRKGAY
jgi:exopolysaccharide biosynthesis polyprenyl glycosylphosphotransferase